MNGFKWLKDLSSKDKNYDLFGNKINKIVLNYYGNKKSYKRLKQVTKDLLEHPDWYTGFNNYGCNLTGDKTTKGELSKTVKRNYIDHEPPIRVNGKGIRLDCVIREYKER